MIAYPAVIVRGPVQGHAALAPGLPVTLLSAPGAALFAGCGWWRALIAGLRSGHPDAPMLDLLDCADASGRALEALRIGLRGLVLAPEAPGRTAVESIAEASGARLLAARPPALDLDQRGQRRRLAAWLQGDNGSGLL